MSDTAGIGAGASGNNAANDPVRTGFNYFGAASYLNFICQNVGQVAPDARRDDTSSLAAGRWCIGVVDLVPSSE